MLFLKFRHVDNTPNTGFGKPLLLAAMANDFLTLWLRKKGKKSNNIKKKKPKVYFTTEDSKSKFAETSTREREIW